jgi:hypothetical protein
MFETFATFHEYVRDYGLQRSEGVLLRYLSDAYKVLVQTVPERCKTADVLDVVAYFRTLVRHVDSSLVEEWEGMRAGDDRVAAPSTAARAVDAWREPRAVVARIRAEMHRLLKALSARDWEQALEWIAPVDDAWTIAKLDDALRAYFDAHARIELGQDARSPKFTQTRQVDEDVWEVTQTVCDPDGDHDWKIEAVVDLGAVRDPSAPILRVVRIGP